MTTTQQFEDTKFWTYVPEFVVNDLYQPAYEELIDMVKSYNSNIRGRVYESKRMSCVFTDLSNVSKNKDENKNGDKDESKWR